MPVAGRLKGRLNQMDCECGPSAGSVPGTLNANALTRVGDVARATFHLAHHELEPCDRLFASRATSGRGLQLRRSASKGRVI